MTKDGLTFKGFKFRLYPTPEQETLLNKTLGCSRLIYNHFLKEKQEHYLKNKKTLNYNNCAYLLGELKQKEEYKWLNEVNSQALQASLKNLETSYGRFFKGISSFPNFKKKSHRNSFTCPQHVSVIDGNKVKMVKFKEGIKFNKHREIKGEICSCTISKTPSGKFYVSFLCQIPKPNAFPLTGKSVGIDLGLKEFLVTSDGKHVSNPKFYKQYKKELKKYQQHLSRKVKGSKRREKARIKVARLHEKITNLRENMQHQVSSNLVKSYDLIAMESLAVKNMVKNHKLAAAISDVGWSSLITKINYKAELYGKKTTQIDRFFPSSKTCNCCGYRKDDLTLKVRNWTCVKCGKEHDRDENAAINILNRALVEDNLNKSSGTDDNRHGAKIRPEDTKGKSVEVSKKTGVVTYTLKPINL